MSLFIFLSRLSFPVFPLPRDDDHPRHWERAVKLDRSGLDVKRAVDDLVGRVERHLDLAGIGVDGEGLMLGECGWSEYDSEGQDCEGFHCISPEGLTTESCFGVARFQLATACGATAAGWVTRVSLAVTRITPGQTLRQNGNTARASALFKPLAATSARRIWGSSAERNFG